MLGLHNLELTGSVWEIICVAASRARQTTRTSHRSPADLVRSLLWWQIRCVENRSSVRCASQRSKSEIPA